MEGRSRLMEQHAKPVDGGIAAGARRSQQGGLARDVDDVGNQRAHRQAVERKIQGSLAHHALIGGVDQHGRAVERPVAALPFDGSDEGAEAELERFCACRRSIDETDVARPLLEQAEEHRARPAPGADHHNRTGIRPPARLRFPHALDIAEGIVIGAGQRTIRANDDAVHRPDASRQQIDLVNEVKRRLLVRNGQVAAGKSECCKRMQGRAQPFGRDSERQIAAGQAVAREPIIVQLRRARMHHRKPHDAGEQEAIGARHRFSCIRPASRRRIIPPRARA